MLEFSSLAYAPLQPMDDDQSLRLGFIFDVFGLQSWFTCVFFGLLDSSDLSYQNVSSKDKTGSSQVFP